MRVCGAFGFGIAATYPVIYSIAKATLALAAPNGVSVMVD
jgi:hypothetical protein